MEIYSSDIILIVISTVLFFVCGIVIYATRHRRHSRFIRKGIEFNNRPFVLVLRSFKEEILWQDLGHWELFGEFWDRTPPICLIDEIVAAIGDLGFPIVLSHERRDQREHNFLHALEINTKDENWFEAFLELSDRARVIVILPSLSISLLKEINSLRERNLLYKVLVIMPWINSAGRSINRIEIWETMRIKLKKEDIKLPPYSPDGLVYIPNENLSSRAHAKLIDHHVSINYMRNAIKKLSILLPGNGAKVSEILPLIKKWEHMPVSERIIGIPIILVVFILIPIVGLVLSFFAAIFIIFLFVIMLLGFIWYFFREGDNRCATEGDNKFIEEIKTEQKVDFEYIEEIKSKIYKDRRSDGDGQGDSIDWSFMVCAVIYLLLFIIVIIGMCEGLQDYF